VNKAAQICTTLCWEIWIAHIRRLARRSSKKPILYRQSTAASAL